MTPTAEFEIKKAILQDIIEAYKNSEYSAPEMPADEDVIDKFYDIKSEFDWSYDCISEFRESGVSANGDSVKFDKSIKEEHSRHYESEQVVKQMPSGNWVSWTYWYGGGKHGQPSEVDWMEYAYYVECDEKEVTMTVRTFTKK